jgi:hypothetical protein
MDDVGPAVRDLAHHLTHDISDTPKDLRDAVAFAPLAAVKVLKRLAEPDRGAAEANAKR